MKVKRRTQGGVQFLEAAIAFPILLMFIAALVEFGRFLYYKSMLNAVAEQAASLSSTFPGLEAEDLVVGGKNVFQESLTKVKDKLRDRALALGISTDPNAAISLSSIVIDVPAGDAFKGVSRLRVLETQPISIKLTANFRPVFVGFFSSLPVIGHAAAYREIPRSISSPISIDCWGKPAQLLSEVNPQCPCTSRPDDPRWVANPDTPETCACTGNMPHINYACKAYGGGPCVMNNEGRYALDPEYDAAGNITGCRCKSPYGGRYEYNPVAQQCECAYPTKEDLKTKFTGCFNASGTRTGWFHPKECQCKNCGPNTIAVESPDNYLSATCSCVPGFTCPPGQTVILNGWGAGCYCRTLDTCDSNHEMDDKGACVCKAKCDSTLYQDSASCNCYCNLQDMSGIKQLIPTKDPSVCSQSGHCTWNAGLNSWSCDFGNG